MRLPPAFVRIGFGKRGRPRVWLPVFLLWPLLAIVVLLAAIVTVPVDIVLFVAGQPYHSYTLLLVNCVGLLGCLRGLTVYARTDDGIVDFDIV